MSPALLQALQALTDADLRQALATIAGVLAHRDGDNGEATAAVLSRIADRISYAPRVPA